MTMTLINKERETKDLHVTIYQAKYGKVTLSTNLILGTKEDPVRLWAHGSTVIAEMSTLAAGVAEQFVHSLTIWETWSTSLLPDAKLNA